MQQQETLTTPKEKPIKKHETLRTIIIAVLLALVFRSCAFEPFHIPSGSMKSTLLVGDYIFVSKYAYGYSRYSFPLGELWPIKGRMNASTPKRGDIIVFRNPKAVGVDYIKRLIGMPGDRIQVKEGIVFINDVEVKRQYLDTFIDKEDPENPVEIKRYVETLPDGRTYNVLDQTTIDEDNTPVYVVPKQHYFLMGDNRDNSRDSRFQSEVGFVPEENLVGRAEVIFVSSDKQAKWYEVWKWPGTLRADRFLKPLK